MQPEWVDNGYDPYNSADTNRRHYAPCWAQSRCVGWWFGDDVPPTPKAITWAAGEDSPRIEWY